MTAVLSGGNISVSRTYWSDVPEFAGVKLRVDRDNELFTIENASGSDIDLKDWYIYSDSGNELFIIQGGTVPAGGSITIGTKSCEVAYDILWDEKNVISNKKDDLISLYDMNGRLIFSTY